MSQSKISKAQTASIASLMISAIILLLGWIYYKVAVKYGTWEESWIVNPVIATILAWAYIWYLVYKK